MVKGKPTPQVEYDIMCYDGIVNRVILDVGILSFRYQCYLERYESSSGKAKLSFKEYCEGQAELGNRGGGFNSKLIWFY